MLIAHTIAELKIHLARTKKIGFVPTMGALHEGHISLVQASVEMGLFCVASIFVNPTQFNNPEDFAKYPIDTDNDLHKLQAAGCDLVFLPTKEELYPKNSDESTYIHDFGKLESTIEGEYRPGHFKGVGQIVHILFEIVNPDFAFFGEKDFQQVQVIQSLVKKINHKVKIISLPTVRENDGLAMSSRNRRLNREERKAAVALYRALMFASENIKKLAVSEIKNEVRNIFLKSEIMKLEYFEIINPNDFELIHEHTNGPAHAVIAAYAGEIRLIDNMKLA